MSYGKIWPMGEKKNRLWSDTARSALILIRAWTFVICDVIYEKGPYCGTNSIGPDQTPRMMRDVWSGPTSFVANEHLKETFFLAPCAVVIKILSQKCWNRWWRNIYEHPHEAPFSLSAVHNKKIHEYEYIKKTDLRKHWVLLYKPVFPFEVTYLSYLSLLLSRSLDIKK